MIADTRYMNYKGFQYFPGVDSDGEVIKLWHQAETDDGQLIDIDFDPYEPMSFDIFIKLVDMGFPKRPGSLPLNQNIVNQLYRERPKKYA